MLLPFYVNFLTFLTLLLLISTSESRIRRAVTSDRERLWEGGVIPYSINNTYDGPYKRLFHAAMLHWMERTCITFQPYDNKVHKDYIWFTPDKCGCCSHVGRKGGGAQIISIGERCDKLGIVVHEIGHVVGFWHEHTRPDRDDFVDIIHDNILTGQHYNFDKAKSSEINSLHETYDYHSIMHYSRDTFSINKGVDTIRPKGIYSHKIAPFIGQRVELSRGDIRQANKLYQCPKCFQTFSSSTATFSTQPYCTDFIWRVIASEGQHIQLLLNLSQILSNTVNCHQNTIELLKIRKGGSLKSPILKQYCDGSEGMVSFTVYTATVLLELRVVRRMDKVDFGEFKVECGGLIEASKGLLESPNWPNLYDGNTTCVWVIRVPSGYRVSVKFHYFQLKPQKDCLYDRLEIQETYSNKSDVLASLCGTELPSEITTKYSNEMVVRLITDRSIQKHGFQLEFVKEIDECLSGANKCDQICINQIGGYVCQCYNGYKLHDDRYSCTETCGGVITAFSGVITSPNWPVVYEANMKCIWELRAPEGYQIFLSIHNYSIEGLNSECTYDYLKISNIDIAGNQTFIKLCGDETSTLQFKSSIILQNGLPASTVIQTDEPYPTVPQSNRHTPTVTENDQILLTVAKKHVIFPTVTQVDQPTSTVILEFNSDSSMQKQGFYLNFTFDVNECMTGRCSHNCENLLSTFRCTCPANMVLTEDGLTCREEKCTVEINEAFGVINSNEQLGRMFGGECTYHLITMPGHQLVLKFDYFNIGTPTNCGKDHIDVYDGADKLLSKLIGNLCGSIRPPTLISSGNELLLNLFLKNNEKTHGFNASFSSKCGGEMLVERTVSYIYSHTNFGDATYLPSTNCQWELINPSTTVNHIVHPQEPKATVTTEDKESQDTTVSKNAQNQKTTVIRISFKHFTLEADENCDYDYIEISERDEDYGNWQVKTRLCGKTTVNPIYLSKKHVMIEFISDRTYEDKGFIIEYQLVDINHEDMENIKVNSEGRTRNLVVYE
ncbi:unnamed protein product [Bursaphelenchus okinawaensis]|uniref:Metalloendopeptidase n=1 Tax=Bursaphelenchus okinawaensis TaxID=465554 RepID=A0A811KU65_9BILA|nr:unnamed protein product [Bursaphelenchus okinawaensis]CAG9110383.1 unnamed protein product [Bursaphelenchus okinawaensis]